VLGFECAAGCLGGTLFLLNSQRQHGETMARTIKLYRIASDSGALLFLPTAHAPCRSAALFNRKWLTPSKRKVDLWQTS
jgi:hypothetical protein